MMQDSKITEELLKSERDSETTQSHGRILVVDDEKNIRSSLKLTLSSLGYSVDTAADGKEAEGILATTPPDVILLDVRLPQRTGIELLSGWVKTYPLVPIILMSGDASVTEALEGL